MSDTKKPDMPDPTTMIENAFLMGLGVLDITKEKVNEFTSELIERGRISREQARDLTERMTEAAEVEQGAVKRMVADETDRILREKGVATRDDITMLRAEVAELRELIMTTPGEGI